jgi:PleD family two-component response regulator
VTISAGIATLAPDETADTFLARADAALYAAKERGRNRIASALP